MNINRIAEAAIDSKGATQKIVEFVSLLRLLKRRKIKTIVEIGTAQGGTLSGLSEITSFT